MKFSILLKWSNDVFFTLLGDEKTFTPCAHIHIYGIGKTKLYHHIRKIADIHTVERFHYVCFAFFQRQRPAVCRFLLAEYCTFYFNAAVYQKHLLKIAGVFRLQCIVIKH